MDRLLQHMKDNDYVDIFSIVHEMRESRMYMVQTEVRLPVYFDVIDLVASISRMSFYSGSWFMPLSRYIKLFGKGFRFHCDLGRTRKNLIKRIKFHLSHLGSCHTGSVHSNPPNGEGPNQASKQRQWSCLREYQGSNVGTGLSKHDAPWSTQLIIQVIEVR